jgi:hypothetical protein
VARIREGAATQVHDRVAHECGLADHIFPVNSGLQAIGTALGDASIVSPILAGVA